MSKVLSANVAAGIAANSAPQFLVEIESAATLYRWATFPCNPTLVPGWTGPDFEAKIAQNGLGRIRRAIDISEGGNVAQVQKWTVKIPNQGLISDALASETFIGRRAELRLIFTDQTAPSWMNALPVAPVGFIDDVTWDEDAVTFHVSDGWMKRHRELLDEITAADFPDAPDAVIGKYKPLLYGDWMTPLKHKTAISYANVSGTPDFGNRDNYFMGLMVKKSVASGTVDGEYLFASHPIHAWDAQFTTWLVSSYATPGGSIPLDAVLGSNVALSRHGRRPTHRRVNGFTGWCLSDVLHGSEDTSHGDYRRTGCNNSDYYQYKHIYIVPSLVQQNGTSTGENCIDEDYSNATTLNAGQYAIYRIHRKDLKDLLAGMSGGARFEGEASYNGTLVNDKLTITVTKAGDPNSPSSLDIATSSSTIRNFSNFAFDFTRDDYNYIDVKLEAIAVSGDDGGFWEIRNLALRGFVSASDGLEEIYACGKGRKFGAWIDSPDHSNSFNSGDLIESPAYMIESLLCDELNLTVKQRGAAIQFQDDAGSVPFFQAPHSASLAVTGSITIECWVKFISFVAGENFIVAKIDAGGDIAPYALSVSTGGKIRFWRGDGTTSNYLESAATLSTGVWYHIVATAAGGSGATRYIHINGAYDNGSSITQAVADGGNVLRIGLRAGASTRTNMILDELRIWDRVITEGEAKQLYNGGSGYPKPYYPSNTKAWWRFDEEGRLESDGSTPGASFTVTDSSGNDNGAASNNHTNMRWVTGASAKIPYTLSEVQEFDSVPYAQAGFDNVAAERTTWKFARQYLDRANSIDMIRELCREAHIGYFTNYLGEETVARIDGGTSGYATPTISRFRLQGEKSSVSVKRGNLKHWYNEFVLKYKINMATGEPEETLFVRTPDAASYSSSYTNLASEGSTYWGYCQNAYQATLQVNAWEYTAQNIRDAATAEKFLKEIIRHLSRRPYIVSGKTGLYMIQYELLDLMKVSHALLPNSVSGVNRFRLVEQELDPNTCEITSTFFDVGYVNENPT